MLVLLAVILFTAAIRPVSAQEITPVSLLFDQYQNDYIYQRSLYQKSLNIYNEKSQIDSKYSTVTTQSDKLIALKDNLIKRNSMLKAYLMALRVKLDSNKAISFDETDKIQNNLKLSEEWIESENQKIQNFNNFSEVKEWAGTFKTKYIEIQPFIYTALVQNEINLDSVILSDINNLTNKVQSQPQISEQDKRLINDIKNTSNEVNSSLKNAYDLARKPQTLHNKFNDFYPSTKIELNSAKRNLTNMFTNLKIIATKINN